MLDIPVAFFQLLAVLFLVKYFEGGSARIAAIFGTLAAMAMLVKGNAIALMIVPPLMIILGRRWDLVRAPGLYIGVAVMALFGLPWQFFSLHSLGVSGLVGGFSMSRSLDMFVGYAELLIRDAGLPLVTLGCVGLILSLGHAMMRRTDASIAILGISALFISTLYFPFYRADPGTRWPLSRYCLCLPHYLGATRRSSVGAAIN